MSFKQLLYTKIFPTAFSFDITAWALDLSFSLPTPVSASSHTILLARCVFYSLHGEGGNDISLGLMKPAASSSSCKMHGNPFVSLQGRALTR